MRLLVLNGPGKGQEFSLNDGPNRIGRAEAGENTALDIDLKDCDPESSVSHDHALISISSGQATIQDLGSLNGIALNRSRSTIEAGKAVQLSVNDEIMLGRVILRIVD